MQNVNFSEKMKNVSKVLSITACGLACKNEEKLSTQCAKVLHMLCHNLTQQGRPGRQELAGVERLCLHNNKWTTFDNEAYNT